MLRAQTAPSGSWICWFCEGITEPWTAPYSPGKLCPACWGEIRRGNLTAHKLASNLMYQLMERNWPDTELAARIVEVMAGETYLLAQLAGAHLDSSVVWFTEDSERGQA